MWKLFYDASRPFFHEENREGKRFLVQSSRHAFFPDPQVFPLEKPPGVRRIAVVGESSADQWADSLRDIIAADGLAGRFEVMNCGMGAASLERVDDVLREVLDYSPDAVWLVFGHNLMYVRPRLNALSFGLGWLSTRSRFLAWCLFEARRRPEPALDERLRAWENFLNRAARRAGERNVLLAVSTLQGNLWFPPEVLEADLDDHGYLEAVYREATGDREGAIRDLERLLQKRRSAFWHFQAGAWLYQQRDFRLAREHLREAMDADLRDVRVKKAVTDRTRALARDNAIRLVDAASLVDGRAPRNIPGWESFEDNCHLYGPPQRPVARLYWDRLRREWGVPHRAGREAQDGSSELLDLEKMKRLIVEAFPDPCLAMAPAAQGLALPPILPPADELKGWWDALDTGPESGIGGSDAAKLARYLAEILFFRGRTREAFAFNDRAMTGPTAGEEAVFQRALFHLRSGQRDMALDFFKRYERLRTGDGTALFFINKLTPRA